jgi:L-methionine (R)-S-oxide reductase
MPGLSLSPSMTALVSQIRRAASTSATLESLQQTVVEVLSRDLAHYSWTEFTCWIQGDAGTLLLGPFAGDPTPHVRIPVTQGNR